MFQMIIQQVPIEEILWRSIAIQATLTTQVISPTETGNVSFRPAPWTDCSNLGAYTIDCGSENVINAFQALWTPPAIGAPRPSIWCTQQLGAIYIMTYIEYYLQTGNDAGLSNVSATVGYSTLPQAFPNFVTVTILPPPEMVASTLQPGDWVWFENRFFAAYDRYVKEVLLPPLRASLAAAIAADNTQDIKDFNAQITELKAAYQGEEGHNCVYLGIVNGQPSFSLYGEVESIAEIQEAMLEWTSVEFAQAQNPNQEITQAEFLIAEITIPNFANFPIAP